MKSDTKFVFNTIYATTTTKKKPNQNDQTVSLAKNHFRLLCAFDSTQLKWPLR